MFDVGVHGMFDAGAHGMFRAGDAVAAVEAVGQCGAEAGLEMPGTNPHKSA